MMSSPPPPQRNVKERLLSLAKKKLPHCASSWINGISPDVRKIEAEGNLPSPLKFLSDENMSQDTDTTDPTDSDSALHTHS